MSRRAGVAAIVLLAWVVGLGVLARRELFRTPTRRMADAAQRVVPGAAYYAVTQGQEQIGFASTTIDTVAGGVRVTDYAVADIPLAGKLQRASAQSVTSLTRALALDSFRVRLDAEAMPLRVSGRALGDSVLQVTIASGTDAPSTQSVPIKGPIVPVTTVPLALALGEQPRLGRSYTLPVFNPIDMGARDVKITIRAESLFVVEDSAAIDSVTKRWHSVAHDTVRAWLAASDGGFNGWIDAQGRVVEMDVPGGFTLRRTAYELAFENWRLDSRNRPSGVSADRDILESTAIAASAPLNNRYVHELRVRLSNVDLAGYDLAGARQRLSHDTLSIDVEPASAQRAAYTLPADSAMRRRFGPELAAEPLLQVQSPEIAILAMRIAGTDHDPHVVAAKINRWVHDSLRKVISFGVPNALQVLNTRSGDCNEHTQLYLALARALGMPARAAAGLAYVKGKFYYHAWPEVYLGDWVAVDPTFGEFPADAAHLRFVNGGLNRQAELLRLIGKLKIDVVETR
jgi:hypothetical protein